MLHTDQDREDRKLFDDVVFIVKTSSYEKESLRDNYAHHSKVRRYNPIQWHDVSESHTIEIGRLHNRPIGLHISYAFLNRKKVMFYDVCSELKDTKMVEEWFAKYLPLVISHPNTLSTVRSPKTDAMNFCIVSFL